MELNNESSRLESYIQLTTKVAFCYIGTPYKWAGNDPTGFDCSGLACELMKVTGRLPRKKDLSAEGLRQFFNGLRVDHPYQGCLVFYNWKKDKAEAVHVEYCINSSVTIGASGGGRKTVTIEDAIRDHAFIKVRPVRSPYIIDIVDPFEFQGFFNGQT